ncbi:hypothetical protein ABPG75_003657 [Micractinium tetrahymenae]
MRGAAHLLALAVGGTLATVAAGRSLAAAVSATSAAADGASGSCVANPEHPFEAERPELGACKACNAPSNTTCVECWPLFSLSDAGECVKCNTSFCLGCRPDEPEFCLACGDYWGESETGYYATEDGECLPCPVDNCMQCQNFNGTCTGCSTFMGVIDGECQECSDSNSCLSCNGNVDVCEECGPGTFLLDGKCKPCPDHCDKCSSTDSCEECESQGFFLVDATRLCAACPNGCLSCTPADTCDQCATGEGWTNMTSGPPCAKCTDIHCTTCTPDTPGNCTICASTAADPWYGGPDAQGKCVPCSMPGVSGGRAAQTEARISGVWSRKRSPRLPVDRHRCGSKELVACLGWGASRAPLCHLPACPPARLPACMHGAAPALLSVGLKHLRLCQDCGASRCSCQTDHTVCDWCTDGYFNDAQLGKCTPCEDRWPHCASCGLDATHSQPGIPACFGCQEG